MRSRGRMATMGSSIRATRAVPPCMSRPGSVGGGDPAPGTRQHTGSTQAAHNSHIHTSEWQFQTSS
eukprot:683735-Prymnesium_polylepis.1